VHPEGLFRGEGGMWEGSAPPSRGGVWERARPLPGKKMYFTLEMACFGEF